MKEKTITIKLPVGNICKITKLDDGTLEVIMKVLKNGSSIAAGISENDLILVEAEKLSMDDEFMKWEPQTRKEEATKEFITEAICSGVKNFYRPRYDPTFTDDGNNICFIKGEKPAVGKSYNWWDEVARSYSPERSSRLGTRLEYGAFLGVLIKKLVEEGKTVEWAWNAVCNDSKELGHYCDSENATEHCEFEPTGSRCICGFYDLANTFKILSEDIDGDYCWLTGGCCLYKGSRVTLAGFGHIDPTCNDYRSVGWLVFF